MGTKFDKNVSDGDGLSEQAHQIASIGLLRLCCGRWRTDNYQLRHASRYLRNCEIIARAPLSIFSPL